MTRHPHLGTFHSDTEVEMAVYGWFYHNEIFRTHQCIWLLHFKKTVQSNKWDTFNVVTP